MSWNAGFNVSSQQCNLKGHDDVNKWKHFPCYWPLCGNSLVTGELPAQSPVTRSFDVFLDLRLNERLSKGSWGWWFETPLCQLERHCNVNLYITNMIVAIQAGVWPRSRYSSSSYYDIMSWKCFAHYWTFVKRIHLSPIDSAFKRPVMFVQKCCWTKI